MKTEQIANVVNNLDSIQTSRRQAIRLFAIAGVTGLYAATNVADLIITNHNYSQLDQEAESELPIPEDVDLLASSLNDMRQEAIEALEEKKTEEARTILNSPEFEEAHLAYLQTQAIKDQRREFFLKGVGNINTMTQKNPGFTILGSIVGGGITAVTGLIADARREYYWNLRDSLKSQLEALDNFYQPETIEELLDYQKKVALLPPIGGKIPLVRKNAIQKGKSHKLPPFLSAEERALKVLSLRKQGKLGESYVDQLTVQGRMRDDFKYAAINLILSGPYIFDWNEPFFKPEEWGGIGPLIHGGGNVQRTRNSKWPGPLLHTSNDRTDFLQRVFRVTDDSNDNQMEEARIVLETLFYQRIAFANSCFHDSLPYELDDSVKMQGAAIWENFVHDSEQVFRKYGIENVSEITWFLDRPRRDNLLSGYGPRYEADAGPINEALNVMEKVKATHPELRDMALNLMHNSAQDVNRIIGLPPVSFPTIRY